MSLNESIVEDAALEWFGESGYTIGHGSHSGWSRCSMEAKNASISTWSMALFQHAHLHTHRIKQLLSHLPCFLISGFRWKHAGESPFKAVCGHVFSITQVPEFAVTETMNGQEVCDIGYASDDKNDEECLAIYLAVKKVVYSDS